MSDDETRALRDELRALDESDEEITEWEADFINSLLQWRGSLSGRQKEKAREVLDRYPEQVDRFRHPRAEDLVKRTGPTEAQTLAKALGIDLSQAPENVRRDIRERLRVSGISDRDRKSLLRLREVLP